jgi:hypothetical protein
MTNHTFCIVLALLLPACSSERCLAPLLAWTLPPRALQLPSYAYAPASSPSPTPTSAAAATAAASAAAAAAAAASAASAASAAAAAAWRLVSRACARSCLSRTSVGRSLSMRLRACRPRATFWMVVAPRRCPQPVAFLNFVTRTAVVAQGKSQSKQEVVVWEGGGD